MNNNSFFQKVFYRRSAICFFVILLLFLGCVIRIAALSTGNFTFSDTSANRLRLTISKQRSTIFDCNMIPLTNSRKKIIAAVTPTPRAITAISHVLNQEESSEVLTRLKSRKPVLVQVPEKIECDGIVCTEVFEHQSAETPAIHLVGYTDIDLNGISGLQKAYDNLLFSESEVYISYDCDGKGNVLEGVTPKVYNDTSVESEGVVSTIDINIQNIAQNASKYLKTGAVVIAEADTCKIRACVSRPFFDCTKTYKYLGAEDSPLFNRAINAYNVGSVFKPCVAAAGIENNKSEFSYTCTGSCEIIDRRFKCHKADGHGFMDLKNAVANSCNTYFYNLSFAVGKDAIYNTASSLRFGKSLTLCQGIKTAKGSLPKKESLENIAFLANLSIGQGELLLSPISILTLYSAIANDGTYYVPSVVEGTVKNGSFSEYDFGKPTRVMKSSTAKTLRKHLEAVLNFGTGKDAKPKNVSAAGKTATAQTGKYENGIEICQGWFCGFFPSENPKYTVTVFSENTQEQSKSCGEIFSIIADEIANLKNLQ